MPSFTTFIFYLFRRFLGDFKWYGYLEAELRFLSGVGWIFLYTGCPQKNDLTLHACHFVIYLVTIEIFHTNTVERWNNKRYHFRNPQAIRSFFFEAFIFTFKIALFKSNNYYIISWPTWWSGISQFFPSNSLYLCYYYTQESNYYTLQLVHTYCKFSKDQFA